MTSFETLRAFVRVADTGSVSRAAEALDLGKSVVSKRIAQLEAALGMVLFSRSTRRVALTPAGEAYLEHARRALAELAGGEERLRAMRSDLSGCIRLTATVSWGQRVLARVLPEFLHLHPGIELELQLSDRVMDVAFERIDLALRWAAGAPPPGLVAEVVAQVGWALVATPGYLAVHGQPDRPDALARHAGLCYWRDTDDEHWLLQPEAPAGAGSGAGSGAEPAAASAAGPGKADGAGADGAGADRREADRTGAAPVAMPTPPARVRVRSRLHVDNPEAVAEAALAGLGIALLPDYLCRDALADGRLERVLPGWTPQTRFGTRITALSAPERARLPRNQALREFLRERLARG